MLIYSFLVFLSDLFNHFESQNYKLKFTYERLLTTVVLNVKNYQCCFETLSIEVIFLTIGIKLQLIRNTFIYSQHLKVLI